MPEPEQCEGENQEIVVEVPDETAVPWRIKVELAQLRHTNTFLGEMVRFVQSVGPGCGQYIDAGFRSLDDELNATMVKARDSALKAAYGAIEAAAKSYTETR